MYEKIRKLKAKHFTAKNAHVSRYSCPFLVLLRLFIWELYTQAQASLNKIKDTDSSNLYGR